MVVIKEGNIFFIAITKSEVSPMLVIEFIGKIVTLFKAYIGTVNEVKIRGNFSLVYQVEILFLSHY